MNKRAQVLGFFVASMLGVFGYLDASASDTDEDEFRSYVDKFELDESYLETNAFVPINVHSHPLLDYLGTSDFTLRRLRHVSEIHGLGSGSISRDHMFAYIHESLPNIEEGHGGFWSNKQLTMTLLENVKIDLWLSTVLADKVAQRIQMPSGQWPPYDGYTSPIVNWPDQLRLGLELGFVDPSSGDLIASEILEVPLTRMDVERDSVIQTYRIYDPIEMYERISSIAIATSLEFNMIQTGRMELSEEPTQTLNYKFIDGFSPEMFASSISSEKDGDDLFYVVKIGAIPVNMGMQSVHIQGDLSKHDLEDINASSFVRFRAAK